MITAVIVATLLNFQSAPAKPLVCAVMGDELNETSPMLDYNGIRTHICCGGCDAKFKADPVKVLANAKAKGWMVGESLFDPVSGGRVAKSEFKMDYSSIRWTFTNAEDLAKFKVNPGKFSVLPKKELMTCAVSGEAIASYADAGGYVDYNGIRCYVCCPTCLGKMKTDAKSYVPKYMAKVSEPGFRNPAEK